MRMRSTINFWRETLITQYSTVHESASRGKADEMIASARPKSKGIEQVQKEKGERSAKPTKGDGGKSKNSKKAAGQLRPQAQAGNGGGVRGQSQSCHQCRQSIHSNKGVSEVKSGRERLKCSQCTRYWCEQCLQNRYGVIKAEADPSTWVCPVCNKNCNCSLCRKKAGKLATGILTPLVKSAGFGNVSDFLDKGTDDIAKVLQWKSPEMAEEATSRARKKRRPEPDQKDESKVKRKRRVHDEDTENSTTLANTPSPISGNHSDGGRRRPKNGQYHRSNGRPKRRRLSHSSYSITIDEDPLDIELTPSAKLVDSDSSTLKHSPAASGSSSESPSTDDCAASIQGEEKISESGKTDKMLKSPQLSKSEAESEANTSMDAEVSSPFRRSQRKRKMTNRYSSHDFRPVTDEEELLASPPERKRRRKKERDSEDKRVSFKSPLCSPKNAESADSGSCSNSGQSVDFLAKQKELEELRSSTINALRESKVLSRQEVVKEKARLREEARKERQEEKRKNLEEKAKLREAKKLNKLATQEKLKLARNLLREAQKDARRRQKEREKKRKQEELHLLKEKRQGEKRRRQELTSVPVLRANDQVCDLEDDTPEQCEASGVPSLPDLPNLELPFSADMIPQFLFVSEFLYTFADALGLKRRLNAKKLSKLMAGGRGLGDLYLYLLQVLVDEDSHLQKQLKPSKRQRDLEHLARTYLHDIGKNGFILQSSGCQSMEESLIILHHLCEEALDSSAVVDHMEACQEQCDQLRKEERMREREKSREISEQLKQLCEGGACSLEHIQERRKEFTLELEEMRRSSEQEQLLCRLAVRNTYLGKDRHNRIFWKLQSFPGVVVEVLSGHSEVEEDISTENEGPVISQWLAINSTEQLEKFMDALHPRGRREKQLRNSLTIHQADIATQLKEADHQSKVKKFYGSN